MADSNDRCPLWQRADGRWCRKIKNRVHYFGTDKAAALKTWERVGKYLLRGEEPPKDETGAVSLSYLCNAYLTAKLRKVESGELQRKTLQTYTGTAQRLTEFFGRLKTAEDLRPSDFERFRAHLATQLAPLSLSVEVPRIRGIFRWGYDAGLLDKPMRFGPEFTGPGEHVIERDRHRRGPRLFTAEELRFLIANLPPALSTMTLLAANTGFGNHDCGRLPFSALDLTTGWVDFPRPKTSRPRRAPLWPETIEALHKWLRVRPRPARPEYAELVFLTSRGCPWVRMVHNPAKPGPDKHTWIDSICDQFGKRLATLGMKRPRVNFYTIRHVFETIAGESRDQVAVDFLMGHKTPGMGSAYREAVSDERLREVVEVVRRWLNPAV